MDNEKLELNDFIEDLTGSLNIFQYRLQQYNQEFRRRNLVTHITYVGTALADKLYELHDIFAQNIPEPEKNSFLYKIILSHLIGLFIKEEKFIEDLHTYCTHLVYQFFLVDIISAKKLLAMSDNLESLYKTFDVSSVFCIKAAIFDQIDSLKNKEQLTGFTQGIINLPLDFFKLGIYDNYLAIETDLNKKIAEKTIDISSQGKLKKRKFNLFK